MVYMYFIHCLVLLIISVFFLGLMEIGSSSVGF